MLVLSRKSAQQIVIGSDVVITVVAVKGNRVTLGIEAPQNIRVRRSELPISEPESSVALAPDLITCPEAVEASSDREVVLRI